MIDRAVTELESLRLSTVKACRLVGKPRATLYRQRTPKAVDRPALPRPAPPNALTSTERRAVMDVLHAPDYIDLPVPQIWARELDAGSYLCSMSTMYRLLREHGETIDRRGQTAHPKRVKPELMAEEPNVVWSWDITRLRGPTRGDWFFLYMLVDIFSRYVPGWLVATVEAEELAEQLIAAAVARERIGADQLTIHADRGAPMIAKSVAELLADLRIGKSHGRPRVSNDNPYSEALFKTVKYCPEFPGSFDSVGDAHGFCGRFVDYYNHEHRHSAIGYHTPASVHFGTAPQIREQRAVTLDAAYAANPQRFSRPPTPPRLPTVAWINPPQKEVIHSKQIRCQSSQRA